MVVKQWQSPSVNGQITGFYKDYGVSPLPILVSNPCYIDQCKALGATKNKLGFFQASSLTVGWYADPESNLLLGPRSYEKAQAYNAAYGKLKNAIRGDTASLGVSLASARQSRDMIVDRSRKMLRHFTYWSNVATKRRVRRREFLEKSFDPEVWKNRGKNAANAHLETIFGWVPLLQDIRDACHVMTDDLPPSYVSRSKVVYFDDKAMVRGPYDLNEAQRFGSVRCTISTRVALENPNLWLANKAGLVNLPGVAWDLIPWSFVVGMFANVNQVLSSYTDFAGLSLSDTTVTTTLKGRVDTRHSSDYNGVSTASSFGSYKRRTVGSLPRPSLAIRVPEMNLATAAMFFSLAVQQFTRFSRLLK